MADLEQRYRILEKLDAGGMAEIYRGEVESIQGFKKQIAIKRILPQLTRNKKFVAMFLDEARVSLYLNHANIVQVFDIGRSSETFFIVMEFVDGMNLRDLNESLVRQRRRVELAHALFMMMEVTKGLGYAHDFTDPEDGSPMGIVHRDISPPNILISKPGEVKLVDFGLAKAASQLEHTEPGVVKGKFSYLSPEAATAQEVDQRADIFACGIILFELLTGRRLFYGESDYKTVELVRRCNIPPMPAINPEVTPELERIVLKALEKDPAQRYAHVYEFQDAMAQFLFSRGLKVTNRDISRLVKDCMAEKRQTQPHTVLSGNVINGLIQEEVLKFTSLDNLAAEPPVGSLPLSPEELGGNAAPLDPRDFIDPRNWSDEVDDPTDGGAAMLTFPAPEEDDPTPTPMDSPLPTGRPARTSDQHVVAGGRRPSDELEVQEVEPQRPKRGTVKRKRVGRFWSGVIILLVVMIVLAGASLFVLHTLGVVSLDGSGSRNADIVRPHTGG